MLLLFERERHFQQQAQNTFRRTLNMLLHYLVKLLMCSNMLQIWKNMKTKCIDFACTKYLSSLVTYYRLITFSVYLVKHSLK